jgi:hypothetical protein
VTGAALGGVTVISGTMGNVWLLSLLVLPGVEALPASAPTKVSVAGLVVPAIAASEQKKLGEVSVHVKVSCGVVSELPVSV